jgi:hypothetical protein
MGLKDLFAGAANRKASLQQAGRYGRLTIPGTAQFTFDAGDVQVVCFEARSPGRGDAWIDFVNPNDLQVTLTPFHGGSPLPIERPGRTASKSSDGTSSRLWCGTFHIANAGDYTLTVTAPLDPKAVDSQLLLGP